MLPWLPDIPVFGGLIAVLLICAVFGAVSGCVIAFLKVPPFIATLGMQTIVYGLCSVITNNQPMGGYKQSYARVASGEIPIPGLYQMNPIWAIPFLALFAVVVGVFMWVLYNKTRHGKYMYAIGGNENAAQVAGVNVPATSSASMFWLLSCTLWAASCWAQKQAALLLLPVSVMNWKQSQLVPSAAYPPTVVSVRSVAY